LMRVSGESGGWGDYTQVSEGARRRGLSGDPVLRQKIAET
jgi:hypothetical protein